MRTSKTFMLKDDTRELLKIFVQYVAESQKRAVQAMMSIMEEQRKQWENHVTVRNNSTPVLLRASEPQLAVAC